MPTTPLILSSAIRAQFIAFAELVISDGWMVNAGNLSE
jgi:hypothetical protein